MIPLFKVFMSEDVIKPLTQTVMSGFITQGPIVEEFEKALIDFIGNPYILTLNSATSGLTLALRLLKQKDETIKWPGFDEKEDIVLTPSLTCFATTAAITICLMDWHLASNYPIYCWAWKCKSR